MCITPTAPPPAVQPACRLPRYVTRTPQGLYIARVPLGPLDRAELGTHPTPAAAGLAAHLFVVRLVAGGDARTVVGSLVSEGVVPAGTLPQWVRARETPQGLRYVGRARVNGILVGTRRHVCPWAAHAAVRRMVLAELARQRARQRERRHVSEYPGVRQIRGGYQARYWLGGGKSLNLGYFTADDHGDLAEWAAGRAWREFDRLHGSLGWSVADAFAELRRSGVVPRDCESLYAERGAGRATGGAA